MQTILANHIKSKKFSHGYFLCGDLDKSNEVAREMAKRIFCDTKNFCGKCESCASDIGKNPDFFNYEREKFQIEDSRELKRQTFQKPLRGKVKVFNIKFNEITKEAQNGLLKIMEEPPYGTHFLVRAPHKDSVIDTLKSRLTLVFNGQKEVREREIPSIFSMSINDKIDLFSKTGRQEAENSLLGFLEARYKNGQPLQNAREIKKIKESLIMCRENLPLNLISIYLFS